MDIAIVTGAETPLGIRLIQRLIRLGCRVHGIGNNFSKVTFADKNFIAHAIDVSDLDLLTRTTSEILEKEGRLHILIHAIDVTPGARFEKLPVGNLEAILKIGLLGPVMLTRLALPNLLRFRGHLINIIPANKSQHPASAANALIEGGLREMNNALFDRARDAGLRVTNLILRQNTEGDSNATPEKLIQTRIDPESVARTVEQLLDENNPNVPNEITLYPRLSASAADTLPETGIPVDPYDSVVLPPVGYAPPEQPKIPTREKERIERTIPYTDEEMEEKIAAAIEDFEAHPERYESESPRQSVKKPRNSKPARHESESPRQPNKNSSNSQPAPKADAPETTEDNQAEQGDASKKRRNRRRGGRNRNRDRTNDPIGNQETDHNNQNQQPSAEKRSLPGDRSSSEQAQQRTDKTATAAADTATKGAVKEGGKPRQPRKPKAKVPSSPNQDAKPPQAVVQPASEQPQAKVEANAAADIPAKKKATKKATKKAVKKTAVKKAVTKKATKKAVKKTAVKKAE
jgi:NAD(P)-dependent dehydrogenase (short-subunit alcohol dehydrogenase family)